MDIEKAVERDVTEGLKLFKQLEYYRKETDDRKDRKAIPGYSG